MGGGVEVRLRRGGVEDGMGDKFLSLDTDT